jgi:hypothetical protein
MQTTEQLSIQSTDKATNQNAAVTDASASPARAKLGILFVHGIGEQKEGETLTAFGEPVIAWIRKWIEGHGKGKLDKVEVCKAILLPTKRYSTDPANCTVDIRITHRDTETDPINRVKQQWLFAESWWGEQVQAPSVFSFIGWLFSRGPFVVFIHFAERARQFTHPKSTQLNHRWWHSFIDPFAKPPLSILRYVVWVYVAIAFLFFTLFLQLFLLITGTLALIPIPAVRKYVLAVLRAGTQIVGDSYGFVANDTQRGAILTRLSENVAWLKARSEKVVIVAHSQGAGVVYEAMRGKHIEPPTLLVTFGAGIAKLSQLRRAELSHSYKVTATGFIVPSLVAALLLWVYFKFGGDASIQGKAWLQYLASCIGIGCTMAAWFAWSETRTSPSEASTFQLNEDQLWFDLYASADPVPQGCLNDQLKGWKIDSERIINQRSILSDHNAYWENKTAFVSSLVAALDRAAGKPLNIPTLKNDPDYQKSVLHHDRTIRLQSIAWWSLLLSMLGLAWKGFDQIDKWGKQILWASEESPLEGVTSYLLLPAKFIEWLTVMLTGKVPDIYPKLGHAALVLALLLLMAYLCWIVIAKLLSAWSNAMLDDFLGSQHEKIWGKFGAWIIWPFIYLLAVIPTVLTVGLLLDLNVVFNLLQALAWLTTVIFTVLILLGLWQAIPKEIVKIKASFGKLTTGFNDATTPGTNWGTLIVTPCVLAGIAGLVIDKQGVKQASTIAIGLGYSIVSILLLVRLYRLCLQRELKQWVASLVTSVPLVIVAMIYLGTTLIANERLAMSKSILSFAGLTAIACAIIYFLVTRFTNERMSQLDS